MYVDPDDELELAKAINSLLSDPDKKRKMIDTGLEYVKRFDDKLIAKQLTDLYETL